jgi:hypothetical protein
MFELSSFTLPVSAVLEESWVGSPIALYQLDPSGIWHRDRRGRGRRPRGVIRTPDFFKE